MTTATLPKYPAPSSSLAGQERPRSESRIDSDSHFNGLYETRQDLRIEGVAEGEIQCEGTLTVAEGARVKAKVTASTITIAGELEGEAVCNGVFQIMPTGQVEATVLARRLIVQEGGFYNGQFSMITDEPAAGAAKGNPPASAQAKRQGAKEPPPAASAPSGSGLLSSEEWWRQMNSTGGEPPKNEPDSKSKPA
jgi:cytoskeletal protein CcmA (bactofilin family)